MEPGTLCPKHYIVWKDKNRECGNFLIFILLSDGNEVMKEFATDRIKRITHEERMAEDDTPVMRYRQARTMEQIKADGIFEAIEANNYHLTRASRDLRISRATMYRSIKRFGIEINKKISIRRKKKDED